MKKSFVALLDELKDEIIREILGVLRIEFSRPMKKEFYSLEEVSEITGLSKSSIKGRYRRGTIQRVYSGNKPLIPATEVEKLLHKLNLQSTILILNYFLQPMGSMLIKRSLKPIQVNTALDYKLK